MIMLRADAGRKVQYNGSQWLLQDIWDLIMDHTMWSARILVKYALIQLPWAAVLILVLMVAGEWIEIPSWLIWALSGLWIAIDIVSYPFVWRAYDWGQGEGCNSMIGFHGIAKDRLDPSGYILVRGELWKARVIEEKAPVEIGQGVVVCGIRGLTLLVQPFFE
jgi:membrane protein implicated in regulation of membrane protease activity